MLYALNLTVAIDLTLICRLHRSILQVHIALNRSPILITFSEKIQHF